MMYFIVRVKRNTPNRLAGLTLCVLVTLLASCSSTLPTAEPVPLTTQSVDLPEGMPRDLDNMIYTAELVDGEMVYSHETVLDSSYRPAEYYEFEGDFEPLAEQRLERVDPRLYDLMGSEKHSVVEVGLVFHDPLEEELPYFYKRDPNQRGDSQHNRSIRAKNESLAATILEARRPVYKHFTEIIEVELGGRVIYESVFAQAMIVEIPNESLKAIIDLPDVEQISFAGERVVPPNVQTGRSQIGSDPYYNPYGGKTFAPIALLDTGVRTSHNILSGAIDKNYDCVALSGSGCIPVSSATDPCDHGTRSAGIIAGNSNQGNAYRGLTQGYINSYNIFQFATPNCGSSVGDIARGFTEARLDGNKVITANVAVVPCQPIVDAEGDAAFDAGFIVVAAVSNEGSQNGTIENGTIGSPACAHKVLGIGAVDLLGTTPSYQGRGPTSDNRVKPDIQAPTGTTTASSTNDTAVNWYNGTSGSTPYAGGAAALISRRLQQRFGVTEPGHTYAHMIAFGIDHFPFNTTNGAGRLDMAPLGAPFRYGKVNISNNQSLTINLPDTAGSTYKQVKAAIWWPESPTTHNVIDLFLKNPAGTIVASSTTTNGIFEKVKYVSSAVDQGVWQIEIRPLAKVIA